MSADADLYETERDTHWPVAQFQLWRAQGRHSTADVVGRVVAHRLAASPVKAREHMSDAREDQISIAILSAGAQFRNR